MIYISLEKIVLSDLFLIFRKKFLMVFWFWKKIFWILNFWSGHPDAESVCFMKKRDAQQGLENSFRGRKQLIDQEHEVFFLLREKKSFIVLINISQDVHSDRRKRRRIRPETAIKRLKSCRKRRKTGAVFRRFSPVLDRNPSFQIT
jgi:hypothetical protein